MSDDFDFDDILDDVLDDLADDASGAATPAAGAVVAPVAPAVRESGPSRIDGVEVPDASWIETIRRDEAAMRSLRARVPTPSRALRLLPVGAASAKTISAATAAPPPPSVQLKASLMATLRASGADATKCEALWQHNAVALSARYADLVRSELSAKLASDPDFAADRERFANAAELLRR